MSQPWLSDREFYVSPHNYAPEVVDRLAMAPGGTTELYDSTLRKIMLVAGLRPRVADLMEIAAALDDIGIRHLTVNLHWWGDPEPEETEWEVSRALLGGGFNFVTTIALDNAMLPHWRSDLETLRKMGLLEPVFVLPAQVYDKSLEARKKIHDRTMELIPFCSDLGMRAAISFVDAGRADFERMVEAANLAIEAGITRLDLADSASSAGFDGIRAFLTRLRAALAQPTPLLLHTHDDFGLATATAVAAVTAGALVEVSVNGISDHAGFPALEEVAVVLESMYGIDTGLRMDGLAKLCELVGSRTLPPHPCKAISGTHAFLLDLPYSVVPALRRGRTAFPPPWGCIDPTWVGGAVGLKWLRQFLAGPILALKLETLGLSSDADSIARVREALAARLDAITAYPVWLDETEVDAVCRNLAVPRTSA